MLTDGLDALSRAQQKVAVHKERCRRHCPVVSARQECRACVDACPRDALQLEPLEVRMERCDGCRLCVEACPTRALGDTPLAQNELVAAWKQLRPGERFVIACGRAKMPEHEQHQQAVCIAGLGWELVLVPLLLGASCVELRNGGCSACPLDGSRVARAVRDVRSRLQALRPALDLGKVVVQEGREGQGDRPAPARRMSRRGLFGSLAERSKATVADSVAAMLDGQWATVDEGPWLRDLVAALLRRRGGLPAAGSVEGLAVEPVISDSRCTRCGICARACPSGTLSRPQGQRSSAHLVGSLHRCLGCEACVRACRESAIGLEPRVELRRWASGDPVVLVTDRSDTCRICGSDEILPGLGVCGACRRSQIMRGITP